MYDFSCVEGYAHRFYIWHILAAIIVDCRRKEAFDSFFVLSHLDLLDYPDEASCFFEVHLGLVCLDHYRSGCD